MSLTPSRSLRGSKSHGVLGKSTWKKSLDDLRRQDHFRTSNDGLTLDLPLQHQPDFRPKSRHFAAYKKLDLDAGVRASGAVGRLMAWATGQSQANELEEVLHGQGRQRAEQDTDSQSSTTTSLDSLQLHRRSERSDRDYSLVAATSSPAVAPSTTPYTTIESMGNNASTNSKKGREPRTGSPATDTSEETSSSPKRLPTPQNVSPIRLMLKRASASTLRLSDRSRANKKETSPSRLTKLMEYSMPDFDHTAAISSVPKGTEAPATYPSLSVSAPTSDQSTISQGTAHARSPQPAASTLSPPPSAHALSPPLSANTFSRPSTATSQRPVSIYSPFTRQQTPIPISAPPIDLTHFNCYQSHRRVFKLSNMHYPVPCMVCKADNTEQRWKCTWCCLRVCTECMEALKKIEGRNLRVVVEALQEKKENHWRAMSGQQVEGGARRHDNIKSLGQTEENPYGSIEMKKRRRLGTVPLN